MMAKRRSEPFLSPRFEKVWAVHTMSDDDAGLIGELGPRRR
jgi:hypothetical protein